MSGAPSHQCVQACCSCVIAQTLSLKGPLLQGPGVAGGPQGLPQRCRDWAECHGAPEEGLASSLLPHPFPFSSQPFPATLKSRPGLLGTFLAAQGGRLTSPLSQSQREHLMCPAWDKCPPSVHDIVTRERSHHRNPAPSALSAPAQPSDCLPASASP